MAQTLWEFEYLHDPQKTAEARRGGLFTVGDIGYFDDEGYLFLCDRVAEVVVSGGVNIYPAEVESVLQGHPAVADVAVVGVPNDEWGEEVRGIVELRSGVPDDAETETALIEHCRSQLAHYKCPRAIDFVETLGRDPNGKLRKRILREPYWAGRDRRI
jgi:long-chain acyl-CoA synthetase